MSETTCPNCGHPLSIDVRKATLNKVKQVAVSEEKGDLPVGVVKSFNESLSEKVSKAPLSNLARVTNQKFSGTEKSGLLDGYANSTAQLMAKRQALLEKGYVPGHVSAGDPTETKAQKLQKLIMGALNKKQ